MREAVVDHGLAANEHFPHAMLLEQRDESLDVDGEVVGSHLRRSDSRTSGASSPYARRRSVSAMRSRSSRSTGWTKHLPAEIWPRRLCADRIRALDQPDPPSLLLLLSACVPAAAPASSQDLRAPHPVAYYDVETVVREARALDPAWQRVAAVEERFVAESAPLRTEVNELRTLLGVRDANLADAQRRVFETQLAQRTIALLVLRTESMRDIAAAKSGAVGDVDRRIATAVARVAREQG